MSEEWYPWYWALYEADTAHLTLAQDGAYRRLIDWYMKNRRPLPADDAKLAGIVRVTLDEWLTLAPVVRKFFKRKGRQGSGQLLHKRCSLELEKQDRLGRKRSETARKGAEERWRNFKNKRAGSMPEASGGDAGSMLEASDLDAGSNADAMLGDATGQDTTLSGEGSALNPPYSPPLATDTEANGHVPAPRPSAPSVSADGIGPIPADAKGFQPEDFAKLVPALPVVRRADSPDARG